MLRKRKARKYLIYNGLVGRLVHKFTNAQACNWNERHPFVVKIYIRKQYGVPVLNV